jgi:hypothetical protein
MGGATRLCLDDCDGGTLMRLRSLGLLAVIALVVASCGGAQPEASTPSEGIVVHGDWTIDIYNPDGSLDQHKEFSNSLASTGTQNLARFLTSGAATGSWSVLLIGVSTDSICTDGTAQHFCEITEPGAQTTSYPYISDTLSVGVDASNAIVLSGDVVAAFDGNVGSVATTLGACASTTASADCTSGNSFGGLPRVMTQTSITPVDVVAGQSVHVEVLISFTSG